jgi:hypothetical protein
MSGMIVGIRFASIDFPVPGGPTIKTLFLFFPGDSRRKNGPQSILGKQPLATPSPS